MNGVHHLQYMPKTPKKPVRPRAISNGRTSFIPNGKCSVFLYHMYKEDNMTVMLILAKSIWKGSYPLPMLQSASNRNLTSEKTNLPLFPSISNMRVVTFISVPNSCEIKTRAKPLLAVHDACILPLKLRGGLGDRDNCLA